MNKLAVIITFISFYVVSAITAYADKISGQFICEENYMDGSGGSVVIFIEGQTLKKKPLGYDDSWYGHHKLIHIGQNNEFKTFVRLNNTIVEDILTITYDSDSETRGYHLNIVNTGSAWKPDRRMQWGKCDKV